MKSIQEHLRKVMDESPGAQYYKVDLHIHTPSSADAQGPKRYGYSRKDAFADREAGYPKAREIAGQIVEKLVAKDIQVAAFTDHNTPGYLDNADFGSPTWFQLVTEAHQERQAKDPDHPPLLLLPGVEITTDRIHVLGIFDNEEPHIIFRIATLLRNIGVLEHEFGEVDGVFGTKSIWDVADAIDEMGGICIPAHINARSSRSLLRQYQPPDMVIERLVQHRAIHVFGVVPTTKPWPDERTYQSTIVNKTFRMSGGREVGFHEWMVEKRKAVPQYLPALGYMMNSDAHSVAQIAESFSWVRLDDLTFRSLASSLRDPFYAIAPNHVKPGSPARSQVLGLSFEGGFADGLVMRFNEQFNCVVGHPASGKTTVMRVLTDTFWGRRLGLRIRDDTKRAFEDLAWGLWDEMLGGEVFTRLGSLTKRMPEDVRNSFEDRFLETHGLPWSFYLSFAQVEPDGRKTIYAAERSRPAGSTDADGKEDMFRYYRSQPLPADLPDPGQIEFSEVEASEFHKSVGRPAFRFDSLGLGHPEDGYQAARTLLDQHLLIVMAGYDEHRRSLWDLCWSLNTAATQKPLDTDVIKELATQARQHLEALFTLRKEFAKSFNATEQEHALRIDFRKGRWQEALAADPAPEDVPDFVHTIRLYLHGQEFYDYLDLTIFGPSRRGRGWDEIPYEDLTAGQRSLMALRLLLNSSRDMAPVFIDAPERWLDNESIQEFYDLRRIRNDQLILFTQNPNIAVLGNAEKIVVLSRDQDRTWAPCAGGLEDREVAVQIMRLSEGGRISFARKLLRYRSELAADGLGVGLQRDPVFSKPRMETELPREEEPQIDLPEEPSEKLVTAIASENCVLYLGDGLSAEAGYPTRDSFASDLLDWGFEQQHVDSADSLQMTIESGEVDFALDSIASQVEEGGGSEELASYLREIFLGAETTPPEMYQVLQQMRFAAVVTPSFDPLVENTFQDAADQVYTPQDAEKLLVALAQRDFFILKQRGDLSRSDKPIFIAPTQYKDFAQSNQSYSDFLSSLFFSRTFLFVGATLDDILGFMETTRVRGMQQAGHFALVPVTRRGWEAKARRLERRYGIQVLPYTLTKGQPELQIFLKTLSKQVADAIQAEGGDALLPSRRRDQARLKSIHLRNIGPFDSLKLELTGNWNILLGDNGVGKSHILKAIAVGILGEDAVAYANRIVSFGQPNGEITLMTTKDQPYVTMLDRGSTGMRVSVEPSGARPMQTEGWLAVGYPANRGVSWERPSGPQLDKGRERPTNADLLPIVIGTPEYRLNDLKQLLINVDYYIKGDDQNQVAKYTRLRDKYLEIINQVTVGMELKFSRIDETSGEILFSTDGGGEVPIEAVSQGTASLVGWVGYLVQRLFEVYGKAEDPTNQFALVLVDEIDAHMHPEWQQTLVPNLKRLFPNVQFVATTHSPLTTIGSAPAEVHVLRRDEEDPARITLQRSELDLRRWRADQVLTSPLFGLESTTDPETFRKIEEYTRLAARDDLEPKDKKTLERYAEELDIRLPTPMEREQARIAFELIRAALDEKLKDVPVKDRQQLLDEAKVQMQENVTGSRRP